MQAQALAVGLWNVFVLYKLSLSMFIFLYLRSSSISWAHFVIADMQVFINTHARVPIFYCHTEYNLPFFPCVTTNGKTIKRVLLNRTLKRIITISQVISIICNYKQICLFSQSLAICTMQILKMGPGFIV